MMQTLEQQLEETDVEKLRPHPRNPRRGVVRVIEKSIDANGWYGAVVAQRSTGYILAGNHRYKAAVKKGAKSLPVFWVDVSDEQALRILLADNRTSDLASQVDDELALLLAELAGSPLALEGTGYSDQELEKLLGMDQPAPDQTTEIEPSYEIIIACRDEAEQRSLLDRLDREGFECRALTS